MYVRRIDLQELRAFKKASVEFVYPGRKQDEAFDDVATWPPRLPNVNVLLGINGSGKSTVLDALALVILSPVIASSGYRPYSLVRRGRKKKTNAKRAEIRAALVLHKQDLGGSSGKADQHSVKIRIERKGDTEFVKGSDEAAPIWIGMFNDKSPAFLVVGYGATRRVEEGSSTDTATRRKLRHLRYERVASLFEEHFTLMALNAWLPAWKRRNPGRYRQVVTLINKLLPNTVNFSAQLEAGEYLFEINKVSVPFTALSDGYRAYIGWVSDLLYHICLGAPSGARIDENQGVVLVDEIDLHIHPEWQRTMIPTLAKALPNLQFIFTTHSPLLVGTLERANVHGVELGRNGYPVIKRPSEEVYGLSANQILSSELFGLDSTRDPAFKRQLDKLSTKASRGERGAVVEFMHHVALGKGAIVKNATLLDAKTEPPEWVRKLAAKKERAAK